MVGSVPKTYENQHRVDGHRVKKKEGERILKFCATMNMVVGNILIKTRQII